MPVIEQDGSLPSTKTRDFFRQRLFAGDVDVAIHESRRDDESIAVQRLTSADRAGYFAVLTDAVNAVSDDRDCAISINSPRRIHRDDPCISDEQVNRGRVGHTCLDPSEVLGARRRCRMRRAT